MITDFRAQYKRLFEGKLSSNDIKLLTEEQVSLRVNHVQDNLAELPMELLNALPNRSEVKAIMDKINADNEDEFGEPYAIPEDDPMFFEYDELLIDGLEKLLQSKGISNIEVEKEDENIFLDFEASLSQKEELQQLGLTDPAGSPDLDALFGK